MFKKAGLELKAFFTSAIIWRNFVAVALFLILFVVAAFYFTRWYSNHGDSMEVADFTGLMLDEVEALARRSKQINVIVMDSLYQPEKPGLMVLDQNPRPGFRVKRGRNIYLTINKLNPVEVAIPEIWGLSFGAAERRLKAAGISIGQIEYRPFERAPNTILEVRYEGEVVQAANVNKSDVTVPLGRARVDLIVAEGSTLTEPVPDFMCRTLQEALAILYGGTNLNLGAVVSDATIVDSLRAYVYRQSPAFGGNTEVPIGSAVDLWITQYSTSCDSLRNTGDIHGSNTLEAGQDVDVW